MLRFFKKKNPENVKKKATKSGILSGLRGKYHQKQREEILSYHRLKKNKETIEWREIKGCSCIKKKTKLENK